MVNTQTLVKDHHRPRVSQPKVNSMDPNMADPQPPKINGVPANFTGPMYQYDVCG